MIYNKLFAYLVRRGKIDVYKEGDIWFTTEDAVKKSCYAKAYPLTKLNLLQVD